ncbi:PLP-dependent aminotransferase family protein [Lysinibacillus halotolerans]|uniref:MocR-like pyridoxine biosynthesis transcription factor PdxR n=1 Tax=Lysinibacillus halotolerans TaxID=1368476 RepID=UPI001F4DBD7B|nr:PLP-dependent aminotransferase family protein [Lysinibacillus halotolerans]
MAFFFKNDESKALYIQLYEYLKLEIKSGRLKVGEKLPSIRSLAFELKVSKQTIDSAYQQLLAEGYVESRPRSGLFVLPMEEIFQTITAPHSSRITTDFKSKFLVDFYYGAIDKTKFPLKTWKRCISDALESSLNEVYFYGDRQGDIILREEIRKYVSKARGIQCSTEQIFICSGTQQSINLISQILELHDQQVAIENPGYSEVRSVLEKYNCQLTPISLEEDGISIEELQKSKAKAVYVTPSHQFPLGMVLPINKRLKLLTWAKEHSSFIVEDDYDSEFRYIGQPIPSLKSLDEFDRVIYCGTFSKNFLPAARCSYIILPENLVSKGENTIEQSSQSCSPIIQRALAIFMREGFFEKHVRRMKVAYQAKHKALIEAVNNYIGENVEIIGQKAGLHILLHLKGSTPEEVIQQASKEGIRIYSPLQHWFNNETVPYIMLGFGNLTEQQIIEGIKVIGDLCSRESS